MIKGQKGITLVALVITIIVMLILAGVTISVVVNGGLFSRAENAVSETKTKTVDEAVELAIGSAYASYYADNTKSANTIAGEIAAELTDSLKTTITASTNTVPVNKDGYNKTITVTVDSTTGSLKITRT